MSAPCPVFGFEVVLHVVPGLSEAAALALWADFVASALEERGLVCEGGVGAGRWSHVVHGEAGQATNADREAIAAWAAGRPEIAGVELGPLVDVSGAA